MIRRGVTMIVVASARMRSGVPTEGGAGAASAAVVGWLVPDPPHEEAGGDRAPPLTARSVDLAGAATRGRYRRDGQLDAGAVLSSPRGAGGSDGAPTGPTCGIHSSQRGRYQFQSPSNVIEAGSNTARTRVASISTATPRPTPSSLKKTSESVANTANTPIITTAALVTTPAVVLIPCETASSVDMPRS